MLAHEFGLRSDCAEQPNLDTELRASMLLGPSVAALTDLRIGDDDARGAVASNMQV